MELRTRLGNMTGDTEKDLKTLSSFVFQQSEELRYLLHNLDVTNFNDLGLMRYENGRLQIYTEKLDIKAKELIAEFEDANEQLKTTIEADINGIRTEVEKDLGDLGKQISTVEQTANGLKSTVSSHTTSINTINNTTIPGLRTQISTVEQTASKIQTTVSGHTTSINNITNTTVPALQSQITQQANKISLVVSANGIDAASIVTAINGARPEVKISADHVNISGFVTFSDLNTEGRTTINAGNITTGTISADRVRGGMLEGVAIRSEGDWNVEIYKGVIYFGDYGTVAEQDYAILTFQTGNTFRFYLPNGRYWELDGSGMNYYSEFGQYINGFQFAN
jgi:archaellum component FlaC